MVDAETFHLDTPFYFVLPPYASAELTNRGGSERLHDFEFEPAPDVKPTVVKDMRLL